MSLFIHFLFAKVILPYPPKGVSFKWSKQKFVCGKIMVKRKITAKLAVIFLKNGGPNRDRTDDLTDANRTLSQSGKFSANGLRCMVCQKLIIQHLQKQKFAMAFSIDL